MPNGGGVDPYNRPGMKLAGKMAGRTAALVIGSALIAGSALLGLRLLSSYFQVAADAYEQLRSVYQIGYHAATVRLMAVQSRPDGAAMRLELGAALKLARSLSTASDLAAKITEADRLIGAGDAQGLARLNAALSEVAELSRAIQQRIVDNRTAASAALRRTTILIALYAAAVILAAVAIGVSQYRSVMRPLRSLSDGVRRMAAAEFHQRLIPAGDEEFAQLARQFNAMAQRLEELYRALQQQVTDKSRQLVQSEALASVGFLAAGLAHEINNPLAIIGGHAEAALRKFKQCGAADPKAAETLTIIAEEAFRCKRITDRLLALARPADAPPAQVLIGPMAGRVAQLVGKLPQFADRAVQIEVEGDLPVMGHEGELTQVMVNLLVNAMEATLGNGKVTVIAHQIDDWVRVRVIDNGRGMDESTLRRVFEPFFTDKPQRDQRGTGLGLSVSHAIIAQHGGRLTAASDGPGRGSVFTVELPGHAGV